MKRILLVITAIVALSCNTDSKMYTLKGSAVGFQDGTKIYFYEIDQNNQPQIKDTLVVHEQAFEKKYSKEEDITLNILNIENSSNNIVFFGENEDLNVTIYADSVASSYVTGGRQNELYNDYLKKMRSFSNRKKEIAQGFQKANMEKDDALMQELRSQNLSIASEEKTYKRNFVNENNNSIFSIMLLSELFKTKELSGEEVQGIISKLNPKIAENPIVVDLKNTVESAKKSDIGGIAPPFEAPSPTGEMISLQQALGKYTIIDFWASWCRPCRAENPNVVKVYEKYHDKGLNIISVSLDREGQKDRWVQAIEDDNMNWYHVSNLQFWQDPIAKEYNVRSIPATFLLDSEGKIIDKNLRGPALEARISQLLD
ncbi:MAG: TlpA disulfide reductase family protein [Flavobacteriaceae bacterium]